MAYNDNIIWQIERQAADRYVGILYLCFHSKRTEISNDVASSYSEVRDIIVKRLRELSQTIGHMEYQLNIPTDL